MNTQIDEIFFACLIMPTNHDEIAINDDDNLFSDNFDLLREIRLFSKNVIKYLSLLFCNYLL